MKIDELYEKDEQCQRIIEGAKETIKYCEKPYYEKEKHDGKNRVKIKVSPSHIKSQKICISILLFEYGNFGNEVGYYDALSLSIKDGKLLRELLNELYSEEGA
jgi:hypothetical protein